MPIEHNNSLDKILDYVPDLFEKVNQIMDKKAKDKEDQVSKITENMRSMKF